MKFEIRRSRRALWLAAAFAASAVAIQTAAASEFSVTPIRADLKAGAMSETITVTNDATARLRVAVKLSEWTQDASGKDVYTDSGDLVYFPRQMDVEPGAKRLVRVGAKAPAAAVERAYRLFIEEIPEPPPPGGPAAVNFYFRFGVPVFLPPAVPRPQPDVGEPTLQKGKLSLVVKNTGNQHFRLTKVTIQDDSGAFSQDIAGWYSLAGSTRTYAVDVPADACRKARTLSVRLVGEGISLDRTLNVDRANCS
jgi:fimbrial chaperone protein